MKYKKPKYTPTLQDEALIDKFFSETINDCKALIENKDIIGLEKLSTLTTKQLAILNHKGKKETQIQQSCARMARELAARLPKDCLKFIQIDNGGNLTDWGRIRKYQEGTYSNFCDSMILVAQNKQNKSIFVEFKRVGSKSEIITQDKKHFIEQLKEIESLRRSYFSAYITNNTVFFENVVMKEIKEFLGL